MTKYRLTLTRERDGIIDNDFTTRIEYVSAYEPPLNTDPEPLIIKRLTGMLLEYFSKEKAKDKGDLPWT